MSFMSIIVFLFFTMDPIGNIPLFVDSLKNVEEKKRFRIICRELLIAFFVLVFFLLCGRFIMNLLHLDKASLHLSGGIVLFIIAIKMIFPMDCGARSSGENSELEPFIVPLAIPLVAGPSTITMLIIFSTNEPGRTFVLFLALLVAWLFSGAILLSSVIIHRICSAQVLIAMERLMGMILVVIAVQMIMDGWGMRFACAPG